jgi:hypothetical protein
VGRLPSVDQSVSPPGGERKRRRALYGPAPRLTRTSPLTGRLVWHIGDWGRASEHIGGGWEAVAGGLARERLAGGDVLVVLASRPALIAEVLGSGLPHADAIRAWGEQGRLHLEPLDFKWSLETAVARQVSGETLVRELEAELPELRAELITARALLELPDHAPVEATDGRFVAPEHPANDAALRLDPQLRTLLLPVDPQAFFSALPAWDTARAVARFEGCDLTRLQGVEAVERYYRLGAGVAGAVARLETGLFEEEPRPADAPAYVDRLRGQRPPGGLNGLLLDLERRMAARRALDEQLGQVVRNAYPFARFRADLNQAHVPRAVQERRGVLGRAYGQVVDAVTAIVREEGRRLVALGAVEAAALTDLGAQNDRWLQVGHEHALLVAGRLQRRGS